jgi:hypothetical protein
MVRGSLNYGLSSYIGDLMLLVACLQSAITDGRGGSDTKMMLFAAVSGWCGRCCRGGIVCSGLRYGDTRCSLCHYYRVRGGR